MPKQNLELERGKSYDMSYTHPSSMAGGTLFFTLKPVAYDSDATDTAATVKKDVTSFTVSNTKASWTLSDSDTYIDPTVKYHYDIVFADATGKSLPASWYGDVKITAHPTNRNV